MASTAKPVASTGADFAVVHLPRIRPDLVPYLAGAPLAYEPLLEELRARYDVIDPLPRLVAAARSVGADTLQAINHHSPYANRLVADEVIEWVDQWVESRETRPTPPGS